MAKIIVYSTKVCPYCVRAKALLDRKGLSYTEVMVDQNEEARLEMMQKSNRRTVPQIFINNQSIGGFDDLSALDQSGELDKLLNQ